MKKITNVTIRNFRNVANIEDFPIDGGNILAVGDSALGKSNFFKALQLPLNMHDGGRDPLRHGATEGEIEVKACEFDGDLPIEGTEYVFRAKLKKGQSPSLEVIAPNGIREKKKSIIGSLVGEIDFDILEFVKMSESESGKRKQLEYIYGLLPMEDVQTINQLKAKLKAIYDDRTEINRELKRKEILVNDNCPMPGDEKKYVSKIDVAQLNEQLTQSLAINNKRKDAETAIKTRTENIDRLNGEIESLLAQIEAKKKEIADNTERIGNAKDYLAKNPVQPVEDIQQQINNASEHNTKVDSILLYKKYKKEYDADADTAQTLDVNYKLQTEALNNFIRSLEFPVDGLSFCDDGIKEAYATYNDKPIDESNMSTAELIDLGVRIKIAKINRMPDNMGVLFIEHGESIGAKIWDTLMDLGKKHGVQYFIEEVRRGKDFEIIKINDNDDSGDTGGDTQESKSVKTSKASKGNSKKQQGASEIQAQDSTNF